MRKFVELKSFFEQIKKKGIINWIDKLTFPHILILWILIIMLFGFVYYFFQDGISSLFYVPGKDIVQGISDTLYFSFITATTTGFGDIIPLGAFRWVSIFEVVLGLLLLAIVTSKLVSIKQNMILNEIYELSINERINRLRASLLLFRQNLHRVMGKIEEGTIKNRSIDNIYIHISSFEDILNEIYNLIDKPEDKRLIKSIDPINIELIFNSIMSSFETLNELIIVMTQHKIEWKREINIKLIDHCIDVNETLFSKLNSLKNLSRQTILDLNEQKNKVISAIKNELNVKKL